MTGPRVLVLGGRTAIALQVCRALHRAGCVVVAADSLATSIARFSRTVAAFERLPRPGRDPVAFVDVVAAVVARHRIDHVVPTGEERLWLAFAAARGRPLPIPVVGALPIATLATLHDKLAFQGLVTAAGLTATDTIPATRGGLTALLEKHPRVVVKPRGQRFGVVVVDRDTPPAAWSIADDAVAQPFVAGEERCGFVLAMQGRVIAAVVYLPRWRFALGPSFGMVPVDDPALVAAMTRLVEHHGLHGAFGVDVIVRADGSLAFLECNPRFTSGLHLIDDAHLLALLLPSSSASSSSGAVAARPRMVAPAMVILGPRQPGPWSIVWPTLWRDFWRSDDVVWDRHDPLPTLVFLGNIVELSLLARREGIPARYATSHQLGWDPGLWPVDGPHPASADAAVDVTSR